MQYVTQSGDTMFNTLKNGMALPIMYDTGRWNADGAFYEVLALCGKGDSISFSLSANELFLNTFKSPVPDSLKGEDLLNFTVGIENVMTLEAFQTERTEKLVKVETETIDKYLMDNDLIAQKTESGLTYIITEQGQGQNAAAGDEVIVHYTGMFMDGKVFDSSKDREEPFSFPLGQGRVIPGWDEGIALLNPGSKATFIIPSALAYGERGAQGAIPPNTILKFEVELLEIKN